MILIRCKFCNKELTGNSTRTVSCGCPNMATITGDKISAVDLKQVVMLNVIKQTPKTNVLKPEDLVFQEERRNRKVRRLEFEVR
jgi:phage FluMu protein Com